MTNYDKYYGLTPNEKKHAQDTEALASLLKRLAICVVAAIVGLILLAKMDDPAGSQEVCWGDGAGTYTVPCPTTTTTTIPEVTPPTIGEGIQVDRPAEGDPGWDCATMGNKICGPIAVEVEPSFTG